MSINDRYEKEPTWVIKPTKENGGYGVEAGGNYGHSDGSGYTVWFAGYATKADVKSEEEWDGNTRGLKVRDFTGVSVGGLSDLENFDYAVDVAEEEMRVMMADARAEFGA